GARAFLTNALYMKTPAAKPFHKVFDEQGMFTPLGAQQRPVNFMVHLNEELGYFRGDGVEIVRFPFGQSGAFQCYLLLPSVDSNLDRLVSDLNAASWLGWKGQISDTRGRLRLPPNEQEYEEDLAGVLSELGLGIAFDDELADFLAMCTGPLKIGAV